MRDLLDKIGAQDRHRFRATVGERRRFSTCYGYHSVTRVLLTNVVLLEAGKEVTDHLWFNDGSSWAGFAKGDIVEFNARVGEYVKGFCEKSCDVKLNNPTKIKLVDEKEKWDE